MPEMELEQQEHQEARRTNVCERKIVLEAVRQDGEEELARNETALAWSGFAAGIAMGFSLLAEGVIRSHLPDESWRPLISKPGYSA